jgi:hypothetical protein
LFAWLFASFTNRASPEDPRFGRGNFNSRRFLPATKMESEMFYENLVLLVTKSRVFSMSFAAYQKVARPSFSQFHIEGRAK